MFHRAHQAVYNDDLLRAGATDASVWAISLRSPQVREALAEDDFCYPLIECDGETRYVRTIRSVLDVTVASRGVEEAPDRMTRPEITAVTLTVSERVTAPWRLGARWT